MTTEQICPPDGKPVPRHRMSNGSASEGEPVAAREPDEVTGPDELHQREATALQRSLEIRELRRRCAAQTAAEEHLLYATDQVRDAREKLKKGSVIDRAEKDAISRTAVDAIISSVRAANEDAPRRSWDILTQETPWGADSGTRSSV